MPVSLDRYLMLQLWQFNLEHIQGLAVALTTVMEDGCEGGQGYKEKETRKKQRK